MDEPLKEVWPAELAPLLNYEIGFTPEGVLMRVRYKSEVPLDSAAQAILLKHLQARLRLESLKVILEQESPPKPPPRGRRR